MDSQGPLPPPPSYEEAQGLQITTPSAPADENEETPPSMPLLASNIGTAPTPDPQNQHFGQFGAFPASTVAVSSNSGTTSYSNVTSGSRPGSANVIDTNEPTSIPIPPGHVPVITCHSCGAKQQIGQYSFLPKTQVIGMQLGGMNYYAPQPTRVEGPTYTITAGQQPGYPPSVPVTGVGQQQCNVAVHYNANQGTVQSQPTSGQSSSENPTSSTATYESNSGCFRVCCCTCIGIIVFIAVALIIAMAVA
ncbi:uncharacterized protein [Argopecten irradians]|uniref:uncharacterized protein isoform X3 n=1 Tax=Argopecten irradians TaxID=31199 RepID=UPI0037209BD8